jgi:hypothetical protein
MKKALPILTLFIFLSGITAVSMAQESLALNQNPRFEESRSRYMMMADSINGLHSTTLQETYKAIDYMADRAEARMNRQAFRRELRLERARNGYGWVDPYYPVYGNQGDWFYNDFGNYRNRYYPVYGNRYYRGYNFNRYNNFYYGGYRRDALRTALPLALMIGWYWR